MSFENSHRKVHILKGTQWLFSTYYFEKDLTDVFDFNKIK